MAYVNLREKTALVIDYGSYISFAQRLSIDFGKVYYYVPWEQAFPKYNSYIIGRGVEGIERVHNIWDCIDECDIVCFPDLYMGEFQEWLRNYVSRKTGRKMLVYGGGRGERMENHRDSMKELQEELGLPTNDYEVITGLTSLRAYLKNNPDKYVKTNILRGMMESFHSENYDLIKPFLDELEHSLGIYKDQETFIVEEPIRDCVEIGYDGFCINGKYPKASLCGIELKDCCYAGKFISYKDLPKQIRLINDKLSPTFEAYGYKGAYSNEIRVTKDGKGFLIDQTCRQPEPNTSLTLEAYNDFSLIIWEIANGEVPNVSFNQSFGVEVIMKSEWAKNEPMPIYFPPELERFVKIKNLVVENGVHYFVPIVGIEMEEIGAVVQTGNTMKEAIEKCKRVCEQVKGFSLKLNADALDNAVEELNKLTTFGVKFI